MSAPREAWQRALLAAALFAIDPCATGLRLRAGAGPVRRRWLELAGRLGGVAWTRVPVGVDPARLLGGLDLAATLRTGTPVHERGLLAGADGGVLVVAMAERLAPHAAAEIAAVLDTGEAVLERDGLARREAARFGVVALDEGADDTESVPGVLLERLALDVGLDGIALRECESGAAVSSERVDAARGRLDRLELTEEALRALCVAAVELGVTSLRASVQAARVARLHAAWRGARSIEDEDLRVAVELVLAPRATQRAAPEDAAAPPEPGESPPAPPDAESDQDAGGALPEEVVVTASAAALPPGLLRDLPSGARPRGASLGKSGTALAGRRRGRPAGSRPGIPRAGDKLDVVATLRAAAPWQKLRGAARGRLAVRAADLRLVRFVQRTETTMIFVVDASGSAAMQRLGEAKGAVELLLADAYVRRDRVALIAFRGSGAQLLLPPTRSLVRAKRSLAGLPGGGGTPLASGLEAAGALAEATLRRGGAPTLVVLTDGRPNVARDGSPGREAARRDALAAAHALRAARVAAVWIDTAPRPQPAGRELAAALDARFVALPVVQATAIRDAVRAVS